MTWRSWCVALMASADPSDGARALDASLAPLVAGVRAGERSAVARALNLAEDRRADARPLVAALLRTLGDRSRARAPRVRFHRDRPARARAPW